jgi:hypothetical protein
MCNDCVNFVKKSISFKRQCRSIEKKLVEIATNSLNLELNIPEDDFDVKVPIKLEHEEELQREHIISIIKTEHNYDDEDDKPLISFTDTTISQTPKPELKDETPIENVQNNNNKNKSVDLPFNVVDEGKKPQRVNCKFCQKNLSIRSIDNHMTKAHPGADERKVKCDLCDNYVLKEKLNRHMALMHGTESFNCSVSL